MADPAASRLAPALGKIASGLYIATARVDGIPRGMLCSFVEQASFAPPMISIAIGRGRPLSEVLENRGVFGLHILSKENGALLKAFARGDNPSAFLDRALVKNAFDVPQFSEAWGFLICRAAGSLVAGDHTLFLAEVLEGALQANAQEPMIRIRANGFSY